MSKFKVGDKVKCICNGGWDEVRIGEIGTVKDVNDYTAQVYIPRLKEAGRQNLDRWKKIGGFMKKGDIVKADDGSWTLQIDKNKLVDANGCTLKTEYHTVLAVNCKLPTQNRMNFANAGTNDTIIQGIDSGKVTFIQERLLSQKHRCNTCPKCNQKI